MTVSSRTLAVIAFSQEFAKAVDELLLRFRDLELVCRQLDGVLRTASGRHIRFVAIVA